MDEEETEDIDNSKIIIQKMATLFADKIMSDIILVVGKTEYPSHKLILCTSSDVFQIMLHDRLPLSLLIFLLRRLYSPGKIRSC